MADFTQTITITGPNADGNFFRVVRRDFENGTYEERSELLGNASRAQQTYADTLRQQAESLAGTIEQSSKFKKTIGDMKDTDQAVETATGNQPTDLIIADFVNAEFPKDANGDPDPTGSTSGWTIRETSGGAFAPIVFSLNNQGRLRYSINGGANTVCDYFGAVMRLRNYPASPTDTDMYRFSNGNYSNSDRSVVIRRPGSTQNQFTSQ